jgi:hypothetical protein
MSSQQNASSEVPSESIEQRLDPYSTLLSPSLPRDTRRPLNSPAPGDAGPIPTGHPRVDCSLSWQSSSEAVYDTRYLPIDSHYVGWTCRTHTKFP